MYPNVSYISMISDTFIVLGVLISGLSHGEGGYTGVQQSFVKVGDDGLIDCGYIDVGSTVGGMWWKKYECGEVGSHIIYEYYPGFPSASGPRPSFTASELEVSPQSPQILRILNTQLTNASVYGCAPYVVAGTPATSENRRLSLAELPVITSPSSVMSTADSTFTCTVEYNIASNLNQETVRWRLGGDVLQTGVTGSSSTQSTCTAGYPPNQIFTRMKVASTTLVKRFRPVDNGKALTCELIDPDGNTWVESSENLNVLYPPSSVGSSCSSSTWFTDGHEGSCTCTSTEGNPYPAVVQWSVQGQSSSQGSSPHQLRFSVTPIVNQQTATCTALFDGSVTTVTTAFFINVAFGPTDMSLTRSSGSLGTDNRYTVMNGVSYSVTCSTDSVNPGVTWQWTPSSFGSVADVSASAGNNGGQLYKQKLTFTPVAADNERSMRCTASNSQVSGIQASRSFTLDVQFGPTYISLSAINGSLDVNRRYTVTNGVPHSVTCSTDSVNPGVTWQWTPSSFGSVEDVTASTGNNGGKLYKQKLTFTPVVADNVKSVTCAASNARVSGIQATKTFTLNVLYKPEQVDVTSSADENNIVEGDNVGLTCTYGSANPAVYRYKWSMGGTTLSGTTQTLTLNNIQRSQTGRYVCVAVSAVGETSSGEKQITVKYAPTVHDNTINTEAKKVGDNVTFKIFVTAEPKPTTNMWFTENSLIANQMGRYQITMSDFSSSLTIISIWPSDIVNYLCQVDNSVKNSLWFEFMLKQQGPPKKPNELSVVRRSFNYISLSWLPGSNGGLDQTFYVEYKFKTSAEWNLEGGIPDVMQGKVRHTVRDLLSSTEYEFRVKARNEFDGGSDGEYSDIVTASTYEVPSEPTLKVFIDGTLAVVSWGSISSQATHVRIKYCEVTTISCRYQNVSSGATAATLTLDEGVHYEIQLIQYDGDLELLRSKPNYAGGDGLPAGGIASIVLSVILVTGLVFGISVWWYRRMSSKKSPLYEHRNTIIEPDNEYATCSSPPQERASMDNQALEMDYINDCPKTDSEYQEIPVRLQESTVCQFDIDRDTLMLDGDVIDGTFGRLFKGSMMVPPSGEMLNVSVRIQKDRSKLDTKRQILDDIELMATIERNDYLVTMMGCCTENDPVYQIVEYLPYGNLYNYLTAFRDADVDQQLTTDDFINFGLQISAGMMFLESKKIVHGDLAARNVFLGDSVKCKVSLFGINGRRKNQYQAKATEGLPIRWMSPECIEGGTYTVSSDVWSYGVLLWEIMTFARTPYEGMRTELVLDHVKNCGRLKKPQSCGSKIYSLMTACWLERPKFRPRFHEIYNELKDIARN